MLRIDRENVQKYNNALMVRGLRPSSLESFEIDGSGYSPKVAEHLGQDYLSNGVIIVDPKQSVEDVMQDSFSAMPSLVESICSTDHVLKFAETEGVYAEFFVKGIRFKGMPKSRLEEQKMELGECPGLAKVVKESVRKRNAGFHSGFGVVVRLDTVNRAFRRLKDIKGRMAMLDLDPGLMLDNSYMNGLLEEANELKKLYGGIRSVEFPEPEWNFSMRSFRLRHGGCEVYGLNKGWPLIAYFGSSEQLSIDIPSSVIIDGSSVEELLRYLLRGGFVKLDRDLGRKAMREVQDRSLEQKGLDPLKMDLVQYYSKLVRDNSVLPDDWFKLRDFANKGNHDLRTIVKYGLAKPAVDDAVLSELLRRTGLRK